MNKVECSVQDMQAPQWLPRAEEFAQRALSALGKDGWDLSILLCRDDTIKGLNKEYRGKDEATDVLSFSQGEVYKDSRGGRRFLAGDIVISLDGLSRNAADFSVDEDEELKRLILHGILHLSGMDHQDNDPSRPMLALQESLLTRIAADVRILP